MVRFTAINVAALIVAVGSFAGVQLSARADDSQKMIAVGAVAPAVVGKSTKAGTIENFDLSKSIPEKAVVLYFFPKAFTGG